MVQKNSGPCSIQNCNSQGSRFCQFIPLAHKKTQKNGNYKYYIYLKIGQQLCHTHYMRIVEADSNEKLKSQEPKNYSFVEQVTMLTKVLY
ncbi:hypothetical protein Glove_102g14 [Diversispora epigaea]|uniref:Uncharacterized protein n=1 Tax=Diversispora epigaea TaxID=1348612 RepID=A0A397JE81_9GLOM|nr:hypothetical protein Glove_102g14 [Diversispora epigaea]